MQVAKISLLLSPVRALQQAVFFSGVFLFLREELIHHKAVDRLGIAGKRPRQTVRLLLRRGHQLQPQKVADLVVQAHLHGKIAALALPDLRFDKAAAPHVAVIALHGRARPLHDGIGTESSVTEPASRPFSVMT